MMVSTCSITCSSFGTCAGDGHLQVGCDLIASMIKFANPDSSSFRT